MEKFRSSLVTVFIGNPVSDWRRWHVCTPQMFVQPLSPEGLALWIQRYTVGSKSRKTRNFGKLPQKLEFCGV